MRLSNVCPVSVCLTSVCLLRTSGL